MPIERAFSYLHAANVANGATCRWAVPDFAPGSSGSEFGGNSAELTFAALRKRHLNPEPEEDD